MCGNLPFPGKQNMKKKWLSRLLIAIAALVVVGGILWIRYGNKLFYKNVFVDADKQVSFAYPEQRTLTTGATNPYLIATVLSPNITEYTPSFNVTREQIHKDMTLDYYVGQTMKQLQEVIMEFQQNDMSSINIDGNPARKVQFSGKYLDQAFSWEQVYTVRGGTIYVLTYLAPTDHFTDSRDDIQTAFNTFSFEQ